MPWCCGTSGSVRARQIPQSARSATEVHTFWPVSFQPPSTRSARVRSEARSEPEPGSEKSWHQTSSPRSDGSTNRSRCASLPCSRIVGSAQPAITMSGRATPAARQLLVDDDLGDGVGAEAVRRRPVRRQVAGLDQRGPPLLLRQPADLARRGPRTLRRGSTRRGPRGRPRPCGVRRRPRASSGAAAAASASPTSPRSASARAQVEVRVVLVGEPDPAEHLDARLGDLDGAVEAGHLGHVGGEGPLVVVAERLPTARRPRPPR